MNDPTYASEPSFAVIDALKLIPLFYTIDWTPEKKAEWLRITGSTEATTKVLCDHVRSAIAVYEEEHRQAYTDKRELEPGGLLHEVARDDESAP